MKRGPATARSTKPLKLTPLGEIAVDVATLAVAAIAFAPEIVAALEALKALKGPQQ